MKSSSDDAWEAFLATQDPARLERERFGVPGPEERPGSAGWREMLAEHSQQHNRFYLRRKHVTDHELELMVAESSEWEQRYEQQLKAS